jgi:hypothetical protein
LSRHFRDFSIGLLRADQVRADRANNVTYSVAVQEDYGLSREGDRSARHLPWPQGLNDIRPDLLKQCLDTPGVHVVEVPVNYADNDLILNIDVREPGATLPV